MNKGKQKITCSACFFSYKVLKEANQTIEDAHTGDSIKKKKART